MSCWMCPAITKQKPTFGRPACRSSPAFRLPSAYLMRQVHSVTERLHSFLLIAIDLQHLADEILMS